MEPQINNNPAPQTPSATPPTPPKKNFPLVIVFSILLLGLIGGIAYLVYQNNLLKQEIVSLQETPQTTPSPTTSPIPTSPPIPTTSLSPSPTNTPTPTPTPTQRPFAEEEKLMRKTLAGFEMFIANSNTAGALTFFTPPTTNEAKEKLKNIQAKDLPFALKSWSFVTDNNYILVTEEIKGGYRVRMTECRTNTTSCPILFLELVRDESAENGFSVDRYYDTSYAYQNNLGEEIKYQGFDL